MFSIGILGFIVWSQFSLQEFVLVALLCCETQVINIATSCNSLLLLITLYSKNISRLFPAAGNIIGQPRLDLRSAEGGFYFYKLLRD